MYYDFLINQITFEQTLPFDSLKSVMDFAEQKNASHVRQSHRDYPSEMQDIIGEHGEWMDIPTFESAIYEYNHSRK